MESWIARLKELDTTCVSDAMDRLGIEGALLDVKPVQYGYKICGEAYTVHYLPCGNVRGTVGDFLDDVKPGQVVVIDNAGRRDCTVWGDIMAKAAKAKGIAGTVIDGVCRDIPAVLSCGYPMFTKGTYMRTGKDRVFADAVNVTVSVSNIQISPGDIILGDDSGVVVIPRERLTEVVEAAEEINLKEEKILQLIAKGYSLKDARAQIGYHQLQTHRE